MMPSAFLEILHRVCAHDDLTAAQAEQAMQTILQGEASEVELAALVAALRVKGETPDELTGFARALRASMQMVPAELDSPLLDTCGTGGDALNTFNISTAAALVAAGAGVRVAKHGNRSISSRCGSADVLEAMGLHVELTPEAMARCLEETGFAFLYAPVLHPALRHAAPVRKALRMRTVFNLLGPLANPANATRQVIGAPSVEAARKMAIALLALGCDRGCVVHAENGMDEVSHTGATHAYFVEDDTVTHRMLHIEENFGLKAGTLDELAGGDAADNAALITGVLRGEAGGRRTAVVANAALALWIAGRAESPRGGVELAERAIDSGVAASLLQRVVAATASLGT